VLRTALLRNMRPLSMREAPPDWGVRGVLPPALSLAVFKQRPATDCDCSTNENCRVY